MSRLYKQVFAAAVATAALVAYVQSPVAQEAKKEGKQVYAENQDRIVESQRSASPTLDSLAADLRAGRITQAEFDERVSQLAS